MSSPASFSDLSDKVSGPEDLFDFRSLTFPHILCGEISISHMSNIHELSRVVNCCIGNLAATFLPILAKNEFTRPTFSLSVNTN